MTNDFSNIDGDSEFRNEITVEPNENLEEGDEDTDEETETLPGEEMDGDFDSAMASAGFGYDEQYEHNSYEDYSGE